MNYCIRTIAKSKRDVENSNAVDIVALAGLLNASRFV